MKREALYRFPRRFSQVLGFVFRDSEFAVLFFAFFLAPVTVFRRAVALFIMDKWIEINLKKVSGNVRAVKKRLKKDVKLMAVVKAGAYGHGAVQISETALKSGADLLGVLNADEGIELREKKIKSEIVLLSPSLPERIPEIIKYRLTPTADTLGFLKKFNNYPSNSGKRNCYLDLDFGLKRWGINPDEFIPFLKKAAKFKNIKIAAISTHIAYSPPKNMTEAQEKLSKFAKLGKAAKALIGGLNLSAANSSVLCDFPDWQFDMVRIGNLLYGLYPSKIYLKKTKGPPIKGIQRPWKFFARIISVRNIKKGESMGYASEYVASKNTRAATIAAGYGDGLTMEPKEKDISLLPGAVYWGNIQGKKAFFIGKPGIAHTLLDITGIPSVKTGDKAELPVRRTIASLRIPRIYK